MTRDDWKDIEKQLVFPGARVTLQRDQFRVDLVVVRLKMRMFIVPYVDGHMRGTHITTECEERRRFMRPVVRKPKFTAKEEKAYGKRWCATYVKNHTRTFYTFDWTSVAAIRRHFTKHNVSVERIADASVEPGRLHFDPETQTASIVPATTADVS